MNGTYDKEVQLILTDEERQEGLEILFPELVDQEEGNAPAFHFRAPNRRACTITVRFDPKVKEHGVAIAEAYDTTVSEVVRRVVYHAFANFPGRFVEYRLPLEQAVAPQPHGKHQNT